MRQSIVTGLNEVGPRYYFHRRLSVHRGEGCLPQCMLGYTLLRTRQTPPDQADPPGPDTPPGADTPPRSRFPDQVAPPQKQTTPPGKQTSAYGQRAAGTHPTGMHSCFGHFFPENCMKLKKQI